MDSVFFINSTGSLRPVSIITGRRIYGHNMLFIILTMNVIRGYLITTCNKEDMFLSEKYIDT